MTSRDLIKRILMSVKFRLRRKISGNYIVIECDDWGLERALHQEAVNWVERKYGRHQFTRWTTDSLETEVDLFELYNLLERYKSKFERPPIITANFITHNVDRDQDGKLIYRSLSKSNRGLKPMYDIGIKNGYIYPQFHGFSHYNHDLLEVYNLTPECEEGFKNGFMLAKSTIRKSTNFLHGEFLNKNSNAERQLKEGLEEFERFFGFKSTTIVPPTYLLDPEILSLLKAHSIQYLQASNRLVTSSSKNYLTPILRQQKGVIFGVRNARLDPHPDYDFEYLQCVNNIEIAFKNELPAVIDFHRVNFSGRFNESQRTKSLLQLKLLLDEILIRWPNAKFITTPQLAQIIYGTQKPD